MKNLFFTLLILFLSQSSQSQNSSDIKTYDFKFTSINTGSNASLRAIKVINKDVIWTSGSNGSVFLTINAGKTWKQFIIEECEKTEFRSLHAWNEKRAIVFEISPTGRAFLTEDGGLKWKEVYRSPKEGAFFNSVKFSDDLNGIAISDPVDEKPYIIKTTDGGNTWNSLENVPNSKDGEINFAASNTCIEYLNSGEIFIVTGGTNSRVLTSRDFGNSWKFIKTPAMSGDSKGLYSINFINKKYGTAVGGTYESPSEPGVNAIYTEDSGKTWLAAEKMLIEYRSCVININKDILFAIGKTGCDYSTDKGKNWFYINSESYYAGDNAPGSNIIYVCGSKGRAAKVTVEIKN